MNGLKRSGPLMVFLIRQLHRSGVFARSPHFVTLLAPPCVQEQVYFRTAHNLLRPIMDGFNGTVLGGIARVLIIRLLAPQVAVSLMDKLAVGRPLQWSGCLLVSI